MAVAAHMASLRAGLADGSEQTSASERELQQGKLRETLGLLLSAGYFRARLASATPFDKVSAAPGCLAGRQAGPAARGRR